jgi:hypothetical protein
VRGLTPVRGDLESVFLEMTRDATLGREPAVSDQGGAR